MLRQFLTMRLATKVAPLKKKFRLAWECGFQNAEIWLSRQILALGAARVLEEIPPLPLGYVLHFPNKGPLSAEDLDAAVTLYRELGCQAMVIHEPMLTDYAEPLLDRCVRVRLAVENGRNAGSEFDAWAQRHRWLTLDVEHLWKYALGDAPLPVLEKTLESFLLDFGEKVIHVHLPGYVPGKAEHRPVSSNPELARIVWDLLDEFGYREFVVSETKLKLQTRENLWRDTSLFREWSESRQPVP